MKSNRALQQLFHADGQLTLRNNHIFEADESNLFSATASPRVAHLFSLEDASKTNQLLSQDVTSINQTHVYGI
jgi:hypothetical protein